MTRTPRPDFLVIGAPKAGTTALHAALAQHPDVFVSSPKEPKYWLCDGAPPPAWCGPGDKHSQQEWIWRDDHYFPLFAPARDDQARGESTPFYLWSRGAHRRIAERLPDVRLVAVVRDPIDRAYSNWMHLWSDGLEPESDFETAFALQDDRVRAGWAPFWRYRDLGRYGEQLDHLYGYVDPDRVLVVRYRDLVDDPRSTVDRVSRFLGIREGTGRRDPAGQRAQLRPARLAAPGAADRWCGAGPARAVRPAAGLAAAPPAVRSALLSDSRDARRPRLDATQRRAAGGVVRRRHRPADPAHRTGLPDWLSPESRGSYDERAATVTPISVSAR